MFLRVLGAYCGGEKVLDLATTVKKMTSISGIELEPDRHKPAAQRKKSEIT